MNNEYQGKVAINKWIGNNGERLYGLYDRETAEEFCEALNKMYRERGCRGNFAISQFRPKER